MTNKSLWTIGFRIRLTSFPGDGANATDQALCGWVRGMVSLKMVFTSYTFHSKSRQHEQDAKRISADTEVLKATYTRLGVVGLTWLHFNFIGSQWISWLSDSWVVTEGFVGCPGMWQWRAMELMPCTPRRKTSRNQWADIRLRSICEPQKYGSSEIWVAWPYSSYCRTAFQNKPSTLDLRPLRGRTLWRSWVTVNLPRNNEIWALLDWNPRTCGCSLKVSSYRMGCHSKRKGLSLI